MIAYLRHIETPPMKISSGFHAHQTPRAFISSREGKDVVLRQKYWLRRKREELALARVSTCAEAKLIHFDLAGRYSVKASNEEIELHPIEVVEIVAKIEVLGKLGAQSAQPSAADGGT